jgi:hypothetical protein
LTVFAWPLALKALLDQQRPDLGFEELDMFGRNVPADRLQSWGTATAVISRQRGN